MPGGAFVTTNRVDPADTSDTWVHPTHRGTGRVASSALLAGVALSVSSPREDAADGVGVGDGAFPIAGSARTCASFAAASTTSSDADSPSGATRAPADPAAAAVVAAVVVGAAVGDAGADVTVAVAVAVAVTVAVTVAVGVLGLGVGEGLPAAPMA